MCPPGGRGPPYPARHATAHPASLCVARSKWYRGFKIRPAGGLVNSLAEDSTLDTPIAHCVLVANIFTERAPFPASRGDGTYLRKRQVTGELGADLGLVDPSKPTGTGRPRNAPSRLVLKGVPLSDGPYG